MDILETCVRELLGDIICSLFLGLGACHPRTPLNEIFYMGPRLLDIEIDDDIVLIVPYNGFDRDDGRCDQNDGYDNRGYAEYQSPVHGTQSCSM